MVGIIIGFGISFSLIFLSRAAWFSLTIRKSLIIILSIVGIVGFLFSYHSGQKFTFYSMIIPPIILLIDKLFTYLSFKLHNRDFYLYLSVDFDLERRKRENDKLRASDIIFSFSLLFIILGLTFLGNKLFPYN